MNFVDINNYFRIQGNKFGVGADGISNIGQNSYCLTFTFCTNGIIGGPLDSDKNIIANFGRVGLAEFTCGPITISKNSFFCNGTGIDIGYYNWDAYLAPVPFATINSITANQVGGNTLPNSIIELFYDDECPGCEGKTYIGSTTADNNGKWMYNVNNTGAIVVTGTDTRGATSAFSTATINVDSIVVTDGTCGRSNGSIKKIEVFSGTEWHWEDDKGNVISKDTDLINVPAGKYRFVTSIGGNFCAATSSLYEVKNIDKPSIDANDVIATQPSCGLSNGSLNYQSSFNPTWKYAWLNESSIVVSSDYSLNDPLKGLAADNYYLKVGLNQDSSCFVKYGPFSLINQSGPSLNINAAQITNSSCKKSNGSIINISYKNVTGNIYTAWQDSIGNIISNNIDLENVSSGKYRLIFKDGSGCDTIVTSYLLVGDDGSISYDTSNMLITASSCKNNDGAIEGIKSTNATTFKWINSATGSVVGVNEDLQNVAAGKYQLLFSNNYGCETKTNTIAIKQQQFLGDTLMNAVVWDASCDINNGYIKLNGCTKDPSLFTFEWIDSTANNVISHDPSTIQNLQSGFYILNATDINGCSQRVFATAIKQIGKPVFDYSDLQILNDTCNAAVGSILNLKMKDLLRSYTWAWYNTQQQQSAVTSSNLTGINAGIYYATVTDQFNCAVTSNSFTIINIDKSLMAAEVHDLYIPRNTATIIQVINPKQGAYNLFENASPAAAPLATSTSGSFQTPVITADRSYFVQYQFGECTSPLAQVNIKVFDTTRIFVPSAFTPNNDGVNDKWHVVVQGILNSFNVSVFNRWGELVFISSNANTYWDGTVNNKLLTGTFTYIITAKDNFNRPIKLNGTIIVIR